MAYLPKTKRFALVASRFDWSLNRTGPCQPLRDRACTSNACCALRRHGFDQDPERVLNLLAIVFVTDEAPSGTIVLTFSDAAAVRLDVECIEAAVAGTSGRDGTSIASPNSSCPRSPVLEPSRPRPPPPRCAGAGLRGGVPGPAGRQNARCRRMSIAVVARIIADVVARGDAALIEATARFDRVDLRRSGLRVTPEEIAAAVRAAPAAALAALRLARDRILAFHDRQRPLDQRWTDPQGVELGWRWTAIEGGGPLCPRRHGQLPVLRVDERGAGQGGGLPPDRHGGADPGRGAQSAGAGGGRPLPELTRSTGSAGAQAIAALAFGTESIRPVGQDRRARQRLCGGRQAPRLRHCRHRHDRRALGGRGVGRFHRSPGLDRGRPAGPGRTRTRPRNRS